VPVHGIARRSRRAHYCYGEVNYAPPVVRQHEEDIQDLTANGRHGEEINGNQAVQMIVQERSPGL